MVWSIRNLQQVKAIDEIERSESDRIMAVVGGAILDQSLGLALELRMRPEKKKRSFRQLFKPTGPLGGQNKVPLGYLLYMYDNDMRDALDGIYTIRNSFAHNLEMSFNHKDKDFVEALEKLNLHIGKTHWPVMYIGAPLTFGIRTAIDPVTDERSRFLINLKIALTFLLEDASKHLPQTNIPKGFTETQPASVSEQPTSP